MRATGLFFALTACHPEAQQRATAKDDGVILCGHRDAPLTRACTLEQNRTPHGLILTVRHPGGGFRRLLATRDGRGVIAADGAEQAEVAVHGSDGIDVALGGDPYRLPATVKQ